MRRQLVACALVAGLVLAACSGGDDDGGTAVVITTTTIAAPPTTAPATTAPATTVPGSTAPTTAPATPPTTAPTTAPPTTAAPVVGDPVVASVRVGDFEAPVGIGIRPGDPAMYVVEQPGRVVRFDEATGDRRVVADIADAVSFDGEQGLLGIAFTADGAVAYLNYTDNAGDTNVVEYAVGPDGTFDTANGRVLLVVDQPYANHNGGDLAIGPDGMLYVALGDGGSGGDPERRASNPTQLLGTILRIDPAPSATAAYTVPADNPFVSGAFEGVPGAPEIWSWGLRNPWRIDIDPVTADLWIADVGQNRLEEVNVVGPNGAPVGGRGANFGWSAFEGTDRYNDDVPDPGNLVFPVLTYEHGDDGCSVSGGAVYRGAAIAQLAPAYVYSDYCSGRIWALDVAGGRNLTVLSGFSEVATIDRGPTGELYVIERSGGLHRLVPG